MGREIANDLLEIKDNIEKAKKEKSELVGELNALKKECKKKFKVESLNKGRTKVAKMDKEINELEKKIEEGVKDVKSKYFNS